MKKARRCSLVALLCSFVCAIPAIGQQKGAQASASPSSAASSDPLLRAMREELDRSKAQLKMENVSPPYYIEYHLSDAEEYDAEAAFGALRQDQWTHARSVRVVVRVGDYKQDSYYGPGIGAVNFGPVDNDPIALRWQLWIATDQAYKAASEALAQKKAALRQYTADQPFDDFAHAPVVESIGPLAKLDFDPKPWKGILETSTAAFRADPKIESLTAAVRFRAINQYLVNSEGTVTRYGYTIYFLNASGSTQAADGMRLSRSPYYTSGSLGELPTAERFEADAVKMVETLGTLREAPVVEEDYRGPVLFSPDAAGDIFNGLVGRNVLGVRPRPGESARTMGDYASNYKSRVLPAFLSVIDDPTTRVFKDKTLIGSYETDDEGVRAVRVPVIQDGVLVNYLLGREPIRDFPESNGHGRAAPGQFTSPNMGVLIVEPKQALSPEELKQKLIEICRQENKPFGYYVETLGPGYEPRMLYRVYEKDGHQELVRGGVFDELDTRALRNELIAAGNDPLVSNREEAVPTTVISPSILFDDLEVKRTDSKNAKLPEYPPPDLTSSR
jgi:TldD protein